MAKVREVVQGLTESPLVFLERLMEAYRRYTLLSLRSSRRASVTMAFIGQSAPDICRKLQRLEGLQDLTLQDLVKEADKVFHKRETEEEKEQRKEKEREKRENIRDKKRNQELTKILAAVVGKTGAHGKGDRKENNLGPWRRLPLDQISVPTAKTRDIGQTSAPKGRPLSPHQRSLLWKRKIRGDGAWIPSPSSG